MFLIYVLKNTHSIGKVCDATRFRTGCFSSVQRWHGKSWHTRVLITIHKSKIGQVKRAYSPLHLRMHFIPMRYLKNILNLNWKIRLYSGSHNSKTVAQNLLINGCDRKLFFRWIQWCTELRDWLDGGGARANHSRLHILKRWSMWSTWRLATCSDWSRRFWTNYSPI